jgi:hypothetical protein
VDQPWRIGPDDFVYPVDIHIPTVAPGDWPTVERWLGVSLPSDYKDLIGAGPTLVFARELFIASPFSEGELGLGKRIAFGSWALATLRHEFPDQFGVALYPEPGGLLAWGSDSGGITYYWDTRDEDCERWTVFATGRPMLDTLGEYFDFNVTGYLAALASGALEACGLGGWPGPDPQIVPVT